MDADLIDFVALPKVELHAHLTGSISRQCLHEIWERKKKAGETELEDPWVVMPEGRHDFDLKTFFPLFSTYIYNLISDPISITHSTTSVLDAFAADGVVHLELRTTPRCTPFLNNPEAYTRLVLSAINHHNNSSQSHRLQTSLLLSIDRRNTLAEAEATVDLAIKLMHKGEPVVGVDLCGDPRKTPPVGALAGLFRRAKDAGLGVAVHFAEAVESSSLEELEGLLSWGPDRLGHVVCVGEGVKEQVCGLARERREAAYQQEQQEKKKSVIIRQMGIELCLSCNVKAGMVEGGFEGHHFGEWWKREDRPWITIATDDVGVFESPLSEEYRLVAQHFGLSRDEIYSLARESIYIIFGSDEEKERLEKMMLRP